MLKLLRLFIGSGAILTKGDRERMLENGRQRQRLLADGVDGRNFFVPVVKLFTPDANCVWLLTELDPDDQDIAYGLCDLGMGWPELAYVRISELETVRGHLGLRVKRDRRFRPDKTIEKYAEEARICGRALGRVLPGSTDRGS